MLDFVRQCRTWADKTHVAAYDVEDLGQLVEAELAQNPADAGDARRSLASLKTLPLASAPAL